MGDSYLDKQSRPVAVVLTEAELAAARFRVEQQVCYGDQNYVAGDYIGIRANAIESLLARAGATEGISDEL